jgi:hypothetical protein
LSKPVSDIRPRALHSRSTMHDRLGCVVWFACNDVCTRELHGLRSESRKQQSESQKSNPLQTTNSVLFAQLDGLFSDAEYLGPSPLDFCASQPLAIKYIWAITFEWQAYHLLKCDRPPPRCLASTAVPCTSQPVDVACRRAAACSAHTTNATCRYLNTHDVSDSVITMMIGYHDRRHQVLA